MTDETRETESPSLWTSFVDALTGTDPTPTEPSEPADNSSPVANAAVAVPGGVVVGQFLPDEAAVPEPDPLAAEHQDWADYYAELAANALDDAGFRQEMVNDCTYHGDPDGAAAWETSAGQSEEIAGNYTEAALTEYAAADAIGDVPPAAPDAFTPDSSAPSTDTTS